MKNRKHLLRILTSAVMLIGCNNPSALKSEEKENNPPVSTEDSVQLTTLVRKLYQWHTRTNAIDFPYKYNNPSDSIFTGIDWDVYAKNVDDLRSTNFFSKDFFSSHKAIALSLDSSMKQSGIEWRNMNDGVPVWNTDADDWCDCQDFPDEYWKTITLTSFRFSNDTMTFNWTWGNKNGWEANKYEMKAMKENGNWRISYIEGFSYYGTVEHYKKMMTTNNK